MSVYKPEKSPHYHYDFRVRGHRFHGSTEKTSRRDAEAIEAVKREEAKAAVAAKLASGSRPMTWGQAAQKYWDEVGRHQKRCDTVEWSLAWLNAQIGEDRLLRTISNADVATMVARRRGEPVRNLAAEKGREGSKRKRKAATPLVRLVSPARVNRSVTEPLRKVLNRARDLWDQEIQKIHWAKHLLREPRERVRELSADEEARLFETLPPALQPVVTYVLRQGVRLSEAVGITGLHRGDIDWGGPIAVGRRPTAAMKASVTIRGKGGKVATIPLATDVRDMLWDLCAGHEADRVFVYASGEPVTVPGLVSAFRRACRKAGIAGFRFHDLRHTAATRIVRRSGNLKIAQKLLRHEDITTTARYAHVLDEDLRRAIDGETHFSPAIHTLIVKT